MKFEYLIDPANGPRWQGLLPGSPDAFFLSRGEGEHAKLFGDLFTVLLSGDETEGQFGIITSQSPAGDIIPTDSGDPEQPPFIPDFPRILAAGQAHRTQFFQDFEWPDA
jgi:quercetin 2,3-dioxygenase